MLRSGRAQGDPVAPLDALEAFDNLYSTRAVRRRWSRSLNSSSSRVMRRWEAFPRLSPCQNPHWQATKCTWRHGTCAGEARERALATRVLTAPSLCGGAQISLAASTGHQLSRHRRHALPGHLQQALASTWFLSQTARTKREGGDGHVMYVWRPVPPSDEWIALGDVVTLDSRPPSLENSRLRCARRKLLSSHGEYLRKQLCWSDGHLDLTPSPQPSSTEADSQLNFLTSSPQAAAFWECPTPTLFTCILTKKDMPWSRTRTTHRRAVSPCS